MENPYQMLDKAIAYLREHPDPAQIDNPNKWFPMLEGEITSLEDEGIHERSGDYDFVGGFLCIAERIHSGVSKKITLQGRFSGMILRQLSDRVCLLPDVSIETLVEPMLLGEYAACMGDFNKGWALYKALNRWNRLENVLREDSNTPQS
jgi:hypothetical protein